MPRDERRRQKQLMKKRSKEKVVAQSRARAQAITASITPRNIIRQARTFPLLDCHISADWKGEMGLVQILISRKQPDGNICFGVFLVDKFCLGLKNTFAEADFTRREYEDRVVHGLMGRTKMKKCSLELAQQMIYQSIDYAAQFGFQPNKDFALSQYILLPRGELPEKEQIIFGKDGKPFFVAGPHDNVGRILRQLEKTAGPGNFNYLAGIGDMDMDLDDLDFTDPE